MHESKSAYSEPMTAVPVEGEVVILGPKAVALSMTPDAAEESARRLMAAAAQARGQVRQA